ncbi:hypothetical protein CEW87_22170 [Parazoarcus communis]|uniref:Restriction endonuclease subunit S n=1 Tax=Parazoarcus communis TaxID=41977 RepID=A0A2U8H802_9RHOO|nr:hypothetical protein [Parazoarcus communis]AWI81818.1 hypothetical protein CEW87_22170 [Parazoarcus communis]
MSATLEAREPVARYLATPPLLQHFDRVAQAPGGVARLRELILTLAVQGKLVPQDPADEPASQLLERISAEKAQLVREWKIRKEKPLAAIAEEEKPFSLPAGWEWARFGELILSSDAGWSPSCESTPREGNAWGVLKVSAVSWGEFRPEENKALPATLLPKPECEVKSGDFLLSRANTDELVARSVVAWEPPSRLMMSDKLIRLRLSCHVDKALYCEINNSKPSREHYIANASGTSSSMKNVSRQVVLRLVVPVPPAAEQSRIVARVEELMALCDTLEETGRLAAVQHERLAGALFDALANSATAEEAAANWQRIAPHFDLLLDRTSTVDRLKQTILQLAVRGRLVPQNPADEPASALLQKIRNQKERLIATGQLKRDKPLPPISEEEKPFELPEGWEWVALRDLLPEFQNGASSRGDTGGSPITVLRLADIKNRRISLSRMLI